MVGKCIRGWALVLGLFSLSFGCSGGGTPAAAPAGSPPMFLQQPQSLSVSAGQAATFAVAASGDPAPAFLWERASGGGAWSPIAGATSATLAFSAQAADEGAQFRARATNPAGSATSTSATLTVAGRAPILCVAIAVHSEDRHNPQTPDYPADKAAYAGSRAALLAFAQAMASRQLRWNWQSDNNFLEACRKWEIQTPDAALLVLTGGKNVVRYLREDLGVECDPHSHENDGYNFADVAWLLLACGVTPAPVVGGHIYDPADANYQDWPRFNAGIGGRMYPGAFWRADLMLGAGTSDHRNDPTASGLWRPLSAASFFSTGGAGLAAFGGWDGEAASIPGLARRVASGELAPGRMWTFSLVLAQQYFVQPGYLASQVLPVLDGIASQRDAGSVEVLQFTEALDAWRTRYGGAEAVHQDPAPAGYLTFTLNTQDFSRPQESAALVTKVLDLHEAAGVPLDVSFTSSQAALFADGYPALWGRLKASSLVALSTHTRAPKPYANAFDWVGMGAWSLAAQQALVAAYGSRAFDPSTGQVGEGPGGYALVKVLAGYAPCSIGAVPDAPVAEAVCSVLGGLGAQFMVAHGRAVNLGERALGLALKPEHVDFQLYQHPGADPGPLLEAALAEAAAVPGAKAPYFVGVKMHDNDFFAQASAWVTVYNAGGRPDLTPPWDPALKSPLLPQADQDAMWALYGRAVRYAAANRTRIGLVNLRSLPALLP